MWYATCMLTLSQVEAASLLQVTPPAVAYLRAVGKLRSRRQHGRVKIRLDDVLALAQARIGTRRRGRSRHSLTQTLGV